MDVNKILKMENQIPLTESDDNLNLSENESLVEGKMSEEWTDGELEENEILSEEISSYNSDLDIYARDVSKYSLKTPSTGSYFYGSPYNIRCLGEIELSRSSRYLNPFNFFPLVALDIDLQDHLWTPEEPPIYDDIGVERYLDLVKENKAEIVQDIISQLHTETMNLKYYGLKNRSYKILLEVLKYNKHIKHLDLTNNVIDSVDVANIFSDMIKQNNTLESINLTFCK
ncbi:uncharacterized protein LOC123291386 [Chrysoperla carnea]|uniref:uncharacterized protein LOC123291386 n=1 Tax=Chrysoperla carnea TaxID=189513 RepID=UPI001D094506|nr:uncharacterized protein LOC123291386 [Chrysoperla carnea]